MKESKFTEISIDYTDDNGVLHLDGYTLKEDEGCVVAYVFNKVLYYTNPLYRYDSLVESTVSGLMIEGVIV